MTNRTALITAALASSVLTAAACVWNQFAIAGAGLGLSVGLVGDVVSAALSGRLSFGRLAERPRASAFLYPLVFVGKQAFLLLLAFLILSRMAGAVVPFLVALGVYHGLRLVLMLVRPSRYVALVTCAPPRNSSQ
jgi:hypothetical protein